MRVIHVLRKPLSEGTVAANTVRHGTGGLNIDGSRIFSTGDHMRPGGVTRKQHDLSGGVRDSAGAGMFAAGSTFTPTNHPGGRWPANVILQHLDGCRCVGTKRVKGGNDPRRKDGSKPGHNFHGFDQPRPHDHRPCSHSGFGVGGKETVAHWICEPGCPVARLDGQSGVTKSTGGRTANISTTSTIYGGGKGLGQAMSSDEVRGDPGFGDTGGASRFYKQVGGEN